jgi:hypothetical protein
MNSEIYRKQKKLKPKKIPFTGILNSHARNVFFYFASLKKATDLQFELQPTSSPPSESSAAEIYKTKRVPCRTAD